ncbi:MAG: hypothetical protein ACU85V_11530 [Gammaproteobacteria bacterium]
MLLGLAMPLAAPADTAPVLRDPTRPPVQHQSAVRRSEIATPQEFVLSAIKIGAGTRTALVNGRLVAEGDQIGEARVLEITPAAVVVEYLAEERRLSLVRQQIRRPAGARQEAGTEHGNGQEHE